MKEILVNLLGFVAIVISMCIMIYGMLLLVTGPFVGPTVANRFANWAATLPFRTIGRLLFGREKRKKRK